MKKTLISVDNLDHYICRESKTLLLDASKILTAGAKDELIHQGIRLVYDHGCAVSDHTCSHTDYKNRQSGHNGQAAVAKACVQGATHCVNLEELVVGVAALLKSECGIQDPEQLKALSLQTVKTIKENL